ncbi:MAG: UDP-3-O-(3-hydroxymyristoyl)glucosamine N-acyltransferase [Bdellovibrionales bacterium]|nr:UDP-3-O-(3-hydroxymyristoyl)glucosamine N-acyltransferase [Bdellovibrionales bacterium]
MGASFTVAQILEWTSGRLANAEGLGSSLARIAVTQPAPLAGSRESDCAFFFSKEYQSELLGAAPGVLITGEPFVAPLQASGLPLWKKTAVVACRDPYLAMAILSEKFAREISSVAHIPSDLATRVGPAVVHPTAIVHPEARVADGVEVGANCVIEKGARIGRGTILYPRVYVGPNVEIGEACVFFPGVTLYEETKIANRVRIHAGSTIGADGFGYAPRIVDGKPTGHEKIYHLGRVVIADDVEIGANTMVDRATFGETSIGRGAKLDNHVHIGHNSTIREGAILCGGVCLAGGTVIGKFAYVGGMAGIGNKAALGDYAKIGAMSLVDKDVPEGGTSVGNPQRTHRDHFKAHAILNRLVAERDRKKEKE